MKIYDALESLIKTNTGFTKTSPSGFNTRNCPMCVTRGHSPDKRQRFGIKFSRPTIIMKCFNCGFVAVWDERTKTLSKPFIEFLTTIGIPSTVIKKFQLATLGSALNIDKIKNSLNIVNSWKPRSLPANTKTIKEWALTKKYTKDFEDVVKYMYARKLNCTTSFMWTPEKKFNLHRSLTIPAFFNNKIYGYISRCINANNRRKYFSDVPSNFIYGLDNIDDHGYIFVTEGALDAFYIKGVATLGVMNSAQEEYFSKYGNRVVLIPDNDKIGRSVIEKALAYKWGVAFPKWFSTCKDLGEAVQKYGRVCAVQSVVENIAFSSVEIKIREKLL